MILSAWTWIAQLNNATLVYIYIYKKGETYLHYLNLWNKSWNYNLLIFNHLIYKSEMYIYLLVIFLMCCFCMYFVFFIKCLDQIYWCNGSYHRWVHVSNINGYHNEYNLKTRYILRLTNQFFYYRSTNHPITLIDVFLISYPWWITFLILRRHGFEILHGFWYFNIFDQKRNSLYLWFVNSVGITVTKFTWKKLQH